MENKQKTDPEVLYSREQLSASKALRGYEDFVIACIGEDEKLSLSNAQARIAEKMKEEVK